jgi:aspartate/methionine/tyrosine aminotransferase
MRHPVFSYMRWAKEHGAVHGIDLTASSAPPLPLPPVRDYESHRQHPTGDGDRLVEERIAARYGVPPDHVLFVPGSTMGNFLLVFLLLERDGPVAVEEPVYENLPGLVNLLRGTVVSLHRRPALRYRLDQEETRAALDCGARLVLLTDLHNPTGVHLADDELHAVRELAASHGATVLVDEVYRDFLEGPVSTAYRAEDPTVVVTSSFTKVYGLGALRAGWILCPPGLRRRAAELLDYLTVVPPTPVAAAVDATLDTIDERLAHARRSTMAGREAFARWLAGRTDVDCVLPDAGVVAFPRLDGIADTEPLCDWLRRERDTACVPGRFFGDPTRIRVAAGAPAERLTAGLAHLDEALPRFR